MTRSHPSKPARGTLPRRCLLAAGAAFAGLLLAVGSARGHAAPRPTKRPTTVAPWRGEVFVIGSSSIQGDLGAVIENDLRARGFDVLRRGVSGSGLARPDSYDWFATSAWLPVSTRTVAVIFYLGVNDGQTLFDVDRDWHRGAGRPATAGGVVGWGHPAWSQTYLVRLVAFIDSMCRRGARDVLLLLPADLRNPKLESRMARIRALQVEAVRWSQCGHALETRGDAAYLLSPQERRQPRRQPDGFHMTRHGAQVIWQRVQDQVLATLDRIEGLAPGAVARPAPPLPPAR